MQFNMGFKGIVSWNGLMIYADIGKWRNISKYSVITSHAASGSQLKKVALQQNTHINII